MSHFWELVRCTTLLILCCWSKLYEESPPDEDMKKYDQGKHRVCLYHEWERPVELIESLETLHSLVPSEDSSPTGAENNILLALYEDKCETDAHDAIFIGAHYQTGPGVLHLAAMNKNVFPQIEAAWGLPTNCSHFVFIPKNKFFEDYEQFQRLSDASGASFVQFINEIRRVSIHFRNAYSKALKLYWYENDAMLHLATIQPGESYDSMTFLGHAFALTDAEDELLVDYYLIESEGPVIVTGSKWCEERGIVDRSTCNTTVRQEMWNWMYEFWARKREAQNYVQPKIVQNFTAIGFSERRLDDDVFNAITNFWKEGNENGWLIEETSAGPVMNQEKSPTFMAYLPENEREMLTEWIRPKLEEWAKIESLEITSLYGIRQYTRGAVLGMHVDTCSTHVISAIINVDSKLDPGKDWPLQIYDHAGQLHEITMKPGDVVFYESAKNGHARFKPLPGDFYANIFIHFRPTDHSLWSYDWF